MFTRAAAGPLLIVLGGVVASPAPPTGDGADLATNDRIALTALVPAPDSVTYLLSPASRFEVTTGKSGFFSFAGHTHLIRARAATGRIVIHRTEPQTAAVSISVLVDSLEVLTPPNPEEIRKVTEAMREEVLHADRFPEITFQSTSVSPAGGGFRVRGGLTLVGETREVTMVLTGVAGDDTVRVNGRFEIKQSDFGIRPYRGGPAGVVRVADRLDFEIAVVAVRAP